MNSREAVEVTGATYRQLDYWVRIGLFEGRAVGAGSGSKRDWDEAQMVLARAMVLMSQVAPMRYGRLYGVEAALRTKLEEGSNLVGWWLVVTGKGSFLLRDPRATPAGVAIELGPCLHHVREALTEVAV